MTFGLLDFSYKNKCGTIRPCRSEEACKKEAKEGSLFASIICLIGWSIGWQTHQKPKASHDGHEALNDL